MNQPVAGPGTPAQAEHSSRVPEGLQASPAIVEMFELFGAAYRPLVIGATMLASFSVLLTSTIINVAIPEIMGSFGVTQEQAQWLSAGFLASGTVTMLIASWTIDSFGIRAVFVAAMSLFLASTLIGGIAPNIDVLIAARIVQGASSGIITPISMVVLYQIYPVNRRGAAMGIYGIGVMLAPAVGPAIGGYMIDAFDWRFVFYVVVPFTLVSIPMAIMLLPGRDFDRPRTAFDWIGSILMTIFIVTLLFALSDGQKRGWTSDAIVLCLGASLLSFTGFIWWESTTRAPMLDLSLFEDLRFAAAAFVTLVIGVGLFASTYLLPLFIQGLQGVPALDSGIMMLPAGLVMAAVFPVAGALSDRVQPRILVAIGLLMFGVSTLVMKDIALDTSFAALMYWFILGRIGLALIFPCLNVASLRTLPLRQLAQGSSIINFARQLGGAFGVNGVAIFVTQRTALYADDLAVAQRFSGETPAMLARVGELVAPAGLTAVQAQATAASHLSAAIWGQANVLAFRDGFYLVALLFFLACIPTWYMKLER